MGSSIGPLQGHVEPKSVGGASNLSRPAIRFFLTSGDYTLTHPLGDATGSYGFRLLDLAAASPIVPGDPVTGNLPSGTETDLYQFSATAGDQFLLDRQALSAGSPSWRLIGPYGVEVYSGGFADSSTLTMPLTGVLHDPGRSQSERQRCAELHVQRRISGPCRSAGSHRDARRIWECCDGRNRRGR